MIINHQTKTNARTLQQQKLMAAINQEYWKKIELLDEIVGAGVEIPDARIKEHNAYSDQLLATLDRVYSLASQLVYTVYNLRITLVELGAADVSGRKFFEKINCN